MMSTAGGIATNSDDVGSSSSSSSSSMNNAKFRRRVIFITGVGNFTVRDSAVLAGATCIAKPLSLGKLRWAIESALAQPTIAMTTTSMATTAAAAITITDISSNDPNIVPTESAANSANNDNVTHNNVASKYQQLMSRSANLQKAVIPTAPSRFLVVDDIVVNQRVLVHKLEQHGFRDVRVASSGKEALSIIQQSPFVFDIILMDVMMPEMDGLETTHRVKALPSYASVPVIAVTGNTMPEDIQACLKAGMMDVMTKPINTKRLLSLITKCLSASSSFSSAATSLPFQVDIGSSTVPAVVNASSTSMSGISSSTSGNANVFSASCKYGGGGPLELTFSDPNCLLLETPLELSIL